MKNKAFTYILVAVVGVVWYQVFLRVKSNFASETTFPERPLNEQLKRKIVKPADFHLMANYRDPFTGRLASAESTPAPADPGTAVSAPPVPRPQSQPVINPWPSIRYFGLVRKTTAADPRTLLSIDGAYYKVRQGDLVLDDIQILKVTRDFVQIRYRKEVKTFYKAE